MGGAASRRHRPALRARDDRFRHRDPGAGPARDRQLDRRQGPLRARALPRADRGLRVPALRDQLDAARDHVAHRHRDREPPARDALRRLSHLSARVLRPPRDRAGALARDQRPLPDPLLHRLGRRAGLLERDDDHRRHDRAAQRERAPGALRGPHDAADRAAHLALRAARDAALARRAAAQGRPHRGGRRVDRRHGDGAGVRARGRGARALPRARRGRARGLAARGRRRGALPPGPHVPALHGDRERALLRRPRRHRREPHDRPVRALQQPAAAARVAARGARLDPQPRPARDRLGQPRVRLARRRAAAAGGRASRRSCPRAGSTCASRTSASPTPAARPCSATSTSRSRRDRSSPCAARRARASRRCSTCSRASTTPTAAACASAASRSRRCARPTCARPSRS